MPRPALIREAGAPCRRRRGRADPAAVAGNPGPNGPFRTSVDKLAGLSPEHVPLGFSYVPGPASGVAFLYHLTVSGHQITNLRLSASTVLKIFTGQITNWDDPQITRDYGSRLPNLPITPVVRADQAGPTFYFTSWLAALSPVQWNAFCEKVHQA